METSQNLTNDSSKTDEKPPAVGMTPMAIHGQSYIDFCAVQGLVTNEDGEVKRMTATQFAGLIGVARETLYDWQKRMPNFWERVQQRRKEIGSNARIMKVYNGLYLKGAAGNAQAAALWLANHDPSFRMPSQKIEHDIGDGLADLLNQARERRIQEGEPVEGEVVNESTTNP